MFWMCCRFVILRGKEYLVASLCFHHLVRQVSRDPKAFQIYKSKESASQSIKRVNLWVNDQSSSMLPSLRKCLVVSVLSDAKGMWCYWPTKTNLPYFNGWKGNLESHPACCPLHWFFWQKGRVVMCLLPYKLFLSAQHEQRIHSKQELEQCSMEIERDGKKKKVYQDEYNEVNVRWYF